MARYNKIYAGPTRDPLPQVKEKLASEALLPGSIVEIDGDGEFALHGAAGGRGAHYVVQDNYLAMDGTDTVVATGDTAIGMIPLPQHLFRVLVTTGNNISEGDPLASN